MKILMFPVPQNRKTQGQRFVFRPSGQLTSWAVDREGGGGPQKMYAKVNLLNSRILQQDSAFLISSMISDKIVVAITLRKMFGWFNHRIWLLYGQPNFWLSEQNVLVNKISLITPIILADPTKYYG